MEIKYFLLTESDNVAVAVISAYNSTELNEKAKIALTEHFDCEIPTEIDLDMNDYGFGQEGTFEILVTFDKDDEDDTDTTTIYVQEVVVY